MAFTLPTPPASSGIKPGSDQYWDWVAHQPRTVRDQVTAAYIQSMGGGDHAHHWVNDHLSKAQESAIAKGDKLPDTNAQTGEGISFTSDKDRAAFQRNTSTTQAADNQALVKALSPDAYTINPTLDKGYAPALHPEQGAKYEGAAGDEQVAALLGANQSRTDTTGVDAQKAALDQYRQTIAQGGLTAIDRAAIEQTRQKRDQEARAGALAAEQKAEMMGRAGSAASRLLAQQAGQSATNQQALENMQTNALGLARKDAATNQLASVGNSVQSAQDAIDNFNTAGERARRAAIFAAQNQAYQDKYHEQNARDLHNTDTYNDMRTRGLGYGATLSASNTDRINAAEGANKSATGGARGQVQDIIAAQNPINASRESSATAADTYQRDADARAEQEAALGVNLATGFTGAGAQVTNALIKKPTDPAA